MGRGSWVEVVGRGCGSWVVGVGRRCGSWVWVVGVGNCRGKNTVFKKIIIITKLNSKKL